MRTKKNKPLFFLCILVAAGLILFSPVMAAVTAGNADFSLAGESKTVDVILDSAPQGVAGYRITVTLKDPTVGQITDVTFPAWASLASKSPVPADHVDLSAVDLQSLITSGSSNIVLATITVQASKAGSTGFDLNVKQLDPLEEPSTGARAIVGSTPGQPVAAIQSTEQIPNIVIGISENITAMEANASEAIPEEVTFSEKKPVVSGSDDTVIPGDKTQAGPGGPAKSRETVSGTGQSSENPNQETIPAQGSDPGVTLVIAGAAIAGAVLSMKRD